MLSVKRKTGFTGILSNINIYINDKKVAGIKQNQQIELALPTDKAKIYVSKMGTYSNELVVTEGQVIEITNSPWTRIYNIFVITSLWLIAVLIPHTYKIIGYIFIMVVSIVLMSFKNGFKLKVICPQI